jgi:cytochrome c-type biogenesis protein CcmH/NrfG
MIIMIMTIITVVIIMLVVKTTVVVIVVILLMSVMIAVLQWPQWGAPRTVIRMKPFNAERLIKTSHSEPFKN